MSTLSKRWQVASPVSAEAISELGDYSPIFRQILFNRGYSTHDSAQRYLHAEPQQEVDFQEMRGVPEAVERIWAAIQQDEPIAVYGDYDVDGVTATALLGQVLLSLGTRVMGYIPNRFDEGYGVNNEALDYLHTQDIRLVITVDCGIRSPEEVEYARRLGMEMIITDHHHPGAEMPDARAVINPKQPGDPYPDKDLAGVGLAYKLAEALLKNAPSGGYGRVEALTATEYLDLVALGTVADLVPLVGENRCLVRAGLDNIRHPSRQGLIALLGVSGINPSQINSEHIGFALGPRLNAAGRLDSAKAALELLTTPDRARAAYLAQQLDNQNRERQQITRDIQEHAEQQILARDPDANLLIAVDASYNPGVVGLAASRLTEKYYRPAIVAQKGEEYTRASCRSIAEFHITRALDQCADILVHHGGHAAAAGFTVHNRHLDELIERLTSIANQELSGLDLRPVLQADAQVALSELRPNLLKELAWLQPTGQGNPQAMFVSRDVQIRQSKAVGSDKAHLKLVLTDGKITYDAIAFRMGERQSELPNRIDILFSFELNEYNGRTTLQLNIRDLKPAGTLD
ncbi:MAG: single-stranded-DNA-specific exonuclease RecJ [Anaerolineales bacterium]|nr:single-stranded-DNA-specific exonuclease RecJ [Anaerolineales bacterium]